MIKKIEDLNYYELLEVSFTATAQEIHRAYERIRRVYEPNSVALYSLLTPEETAAIHQRIEEAYRTLAYEDNRKRYDATLRSRNEMPEPAPPPPSIPRYRTRAAQPELPLQSENRYAGADAPPPSIPRYRTRAAQPELPLQSENRYAGADAPPPQPTPAPDKPAQGEVSPVSPFITEFTGPVIKVLREQRGLTIRNIADSTKVGSRYLEYIEEENYAKLPARPYLRGFLGLYAKALGYEPDRMISDYLKRYDAAMNPKSK
jgi:curved DNA-binding protein CbpA